MAGVDVSSLVARESVNLVLTVCKLCVRNGIDLMSSCCAATKEVHTASSMESTHSNLNPMVGWKRVDVDPVRTHTTSRVLQTISRDWMRSV